MDKPSVTHPLAEQLREAFVASDADTGGEFPSVGLVAMSRRSGPPLYGRINRLDVPRGAVTVLHVEARHSKFDRIQFRSVPLHIVMDDITSIRRIDPTEVPVSSFPAV